MSRYLSLGYLAIILCLYSCNTTKKSDVNATAINKAQNQSRTINSQEMLDKGFIKGTLSQVKSKECPYMLTVETYKDQLDPINLQDFYTDDVPQKVWVKYNNLRRQNRCNEARPVSITEISKRDEGN